MPTSEALAPGARAALAGIGLAQGVTYWLHHLGEPYSSELAEACAIGVVAWVTVAGLAAQGAWTGRNPIRLAVMCGALGLPFALCAGWVWAQSQPPAAGSAAATFPVAAFGAFYVFAPFAQIAQRSGSVRFPYSELFAHSWTNFFVGAMGLSYAALLAAILLLWGALFDLIGIEFFSKLFQAEWFVRLIYPVVFALGVAAGRDGARFTDAGRTAALAAFRFLLPLLSFVTLLFLAALVFTGLQPLWDTGHAAALLLALCLVLVLFANAAFEDGEREPSLPVWARSAASAALLVLPVVAGLAAYAVWLRVDQYGLSPQRFLGFVFSVIALAFGLAYAFAALRVRSPWLASIRAPNVALSLGLAATLLLLYSPVLDPLGWSARSQLGRLLRGRADPKAFDYASLRFHLGRPGLAALDQLENLQDHPALLDIRAGVRTARNLEYYTPPSAPPTDLKLELAGDATELPDGLSEMIAEWINCRETTACVVFPIELNRQEGREYCVVAAHPGETIHWWQTVCLGRSETGWRRLGTLLPRRGDVEMTKDSLLHSQPASVPAELDDVKIEGHSFAVVR